MNREATAPAPSRLGALRGGASFDDSRETDSSSDSFDSDSDSSFAHSGFSDDVFDDARGSEDDEGGGGDRGKHLLDEGEYENSSFCSSSSDRSVASHGSGPGDYHEGTGSSDEGGSPVSSTRQRYSADGMHSATAMAFAKHKRVRLSLKDSVSVATDGNADDDSVIQI